MIGWLLPLGCAAPERPPAQPPIQAMLAVHVEPLPRDETAACANPNYAPCGVPMGAPFQRRTQNLSWLLERWVQADRTVEVLLGPEAALAWTADPTTRGWLAADLGEARVEALSDEVLAAFEAARDAGLLSLGVHLHAVVEDDSGLLGSGPIGEEGGPQKCDAWEGDPVAPGNPEVTAAALTYGVGGAEALAERLAVPLVAISSHIPRAMGDKVAVVEDPSAWGGAWFQPQSLSKGGSECFQQAVDHPPFEGFRTDGETALGVGEGPLVLPGERSLGSMAVHLGEDSDASLGAARRRLLQLLLNRRHAALTGQAARPWLYTFFTHDYQLNPDHGEPPERDAVRAQEGHAYRADVLGIAEDVDALTELDGWLGDAGPVAAWHRVEDLDVADSQFSYAPEDGGAPLEGLVAEAYPYLPLVAERLADTHLLCAGSAGEVAVFSLLRCAGGWAWDGGLACGGEAEAVWVLVPPEADTCVPVDGGALRAGAVDDAALSAARWCAGGGLAVPREGLIVEPGDARWWPGGCGE